MAGIRSPDIDTSLPPVPDGTTAEARSRRSPSMAWESDDGRGAKRPDEARACGQRAQLPKYHRPSGG